MPRKKIKRYRNVEEVFRTHIPNYRPAGTLPLIENPKDVGRRLANEILRDFRQDFDSKITQQPKQKIATQ